MTAGVTPARVAWLWTGRRILTGCLEVLLSRVDVTQGAGDNNQGTPHWLSRAQGPPFSLPTAGAGKGVRVYRRPVMLDVRTLLNWLRMRRRG